MKLGLGSKTRAKNTVENFAGGPVVENPPAGAEDIGLSLPLGRFHLLLGT